MTLSSGLRWSALIAVLAAIGCGTALGIGHYRAATDRARRTELALAEVRSTTAAANASEWQMIARRRVSAAERAALAAEVEGARSEAIAIAAADRAAAPVAQHVAALLEVYRGAVQSSRGVEPAFTRIDRVLTQAVAATETRRAREEQHAILAARLIVVAAAIGMLVAIGLFARARRRVLLSEIERTSLRTQVDERGFEADHDELTGLLNRRGFFTSLRRAIDARGARVAVLLLDLDGFKEINDTLGHGAGDTLLRQIGERLRATLRDTDEIARLGGDEFAVLVDASGTTSHEAGGIGQRVRAALTAPFEVAGLSLQVRASVGVALFPEHGTAAEELLRQADIAMYQAKQRRIGYAVYASSSDPRGGQTLQLSSDLERALGAGELVVHYQPKADVATGAITGAEALVRWQHPERGLLSPDAFIPIAERNGLIRRLTLQVVEEGLAQQSRWLAAGLDVPLAVNLSVANLLDAELPRDIAHLLEETRTAPSRLKLEITESYLIADPTLIQRNIQELCEQGVGLALDDFGTGYSSLTHLRRLPIDEIKIDRSFIADLETAPEDAVIVQSTIELAHSLDLTVVAEGVESELTWRKLDDFGCDQAQGFYLARPMPAAALTAWLVTRAGTSARVRR